MGNLAVSADNLGITIRDLAVSPSNFRIATHNFGISDGHPAIRLNQAKSQRL
jgi:hypothetical protein